MLNGLDLFSGIGGISLALSPWIRTIAYCESDRYCQGVLLSRMSDNQIDAAPIWDDVTTLIPSVLPRDGIDIIFGGFPCQDTSVAGTGKGLGGERSGLYREIIRLVSEIRPRFVFLENVPAITIRGLDRITLDFASLRYDCRWTIVSAQEVGAPHIRERWFLLAHSDGERLRKESGAIKPGKIGKVKIQSYKFGEAGKASRPPKRKIKPRVSRANDGVPYTVDRARALGNAVVPAQAREAFKRLIGLVDEESGE